LNFKLGGKETRHGSDILIDRLTSKPQYQLTRSLITCGEKGSANFCGGQTKKVWPLFNSCGRSQFVLTLTHM